MKITAYYSHLNGLEYLFVHHPTMWSEIKEIINSIDAEACKTKISREKTMKGKLLYSPVDMNKAMKEGFEIYDWKESRVSYWVTEKENLIRQTMHMPAEKQKRGDRKSW